MSQMRHADVPTEKIAFTYDIYVNETTTNMTEHHRFMINNVTKSNHRLNVAVQCLVCFVALKLVLHCFTGFLMFCLKCICFMW